MPDLEFTGERVIPGLVEANLFHEHMSRYRFAARWVEQFARDGRILDAGCGSGYGSAQLAAYADVVAVDFASEAVAYAREHFANARITFEQASCDALPFDDRSFDAVAAFEVIEHLENWPALLTEARRVLRESGCLFVSTPNQAYYAETRATAGPNPFHVHEFDYAGFESALSQVFPHVAIFSQNHAEGIVFASGKNTRGSVEMADTPNHEQAHFYLAICSMQPIAVPEPYVWLPEAGNILQTRERHIQLLQAEVEQKSVWLDKLQTQHAQLAQEHDKVVAELRQTHTGYQERIAAREQEFLVTGQRWAERAALLEDEMKEVSAGYERQLDLMQKEMAAAQAHQEQFDRELADVHRGYSAKVRELEAELQSTSSGYENVVKTLQQELVTVHAGYQAEMERAATESNDRYALTQAELQAALAQLRAVDQSKWSRLGRTLGLGPKVSAG